MLDKAKKFLKIIQIKNKQKAINKQFEKDGLTDEVLEAQIELNKERNTYDIPDENELVYEQYVQ